MTNRKAPESMAMTEKRRAPIKAFCPQCGVGVGFDDDGCCTSCGAMVCGMDDVEKHLNRVGYYELQECPQHGRGCQDARCDVREQADAGPVRGCGCPDR
jgi:hypothetical protein